MVVKGFVPTPPGTVDVMVDLLFRDRTPEPRDRVLDPGCGAGAFIEGVLRWCARRACRPLRLTGVEADPRFLPDLRAKFGRERAVEIVHADFLDGAAQTYDYVIGNPPYVAITGLSEAEKSRYRRRFATARGRFDLYLLFFEQALRQLRPDGRLVFITPEKFLYVETAGALREMLARMRVEEIRLVREDTFGDLVTYPTITVVANAAPGTTRVLRRDGTSIDVRLSDRRASWLPLVNGARGPEDGRVLADVCVRISCGVATGADGVFVHRTDRLDAALRPFAYPTLAGRELTPSTTEPHGRFSMLLPYDPGGTLLPMERLGPLRRYLHEKNVQARLRARTCVARKPWYAFHETPPLPDILRPKILCKDIGERPRFWIDRAGTIVPRHSLYYIVPKDPSWLDPLVAYLRSEAVLAWLEARCQRAAKGFVRLQSRVLQRLPIPGDVLPEGAWKAAAASPEEAVQEAFPFG